MGSPGADQGRTREASGEGPEDESPVTESRRGERECGDRGGDCLGTIGPGEPPKVQITSQQRPRHRLRGGHKEGKAPNDDDQLDRRFAEEPRHQSGERRREQDQPAADQQRKSADPGDLVGVQVPALHDGEAQPEFVQELNEAEVDHRHPDEAIVRRRQQSCDHERRGPAEDLRGPAHRPGPRETAQQRAVERARRGRLALHG